MIILFIHKQAYSLVHPHPYVVVLTSTKVLVYLYWSSATFCYCKTRHLELGLADDAEELDLEDEDSVGSDETASATGAVGEVGGDVQLVLVTNVHELKGLGPTTDNTANTKLSRSTALVGGVELTAINKGTTVVDLDGVAGHRHKRGSATVEDLVAKTRGSANNAFLHGLLLKEALSNALVVSGIVGLGVSHGEHGNSNNNEDSNGLIINSVKGTR